MNRLLTGGVALLMVMMIAACNISTPDITPTAEILISDTPTPETSPSATSSPTPSVTATEAVVEVPVQIASPLPTQAPDSVGPVPDVPPTATTGPCVETVQSGDTLTIILFRQPCGNTVSNDLIRAVVAFNTNITNADILPPVGSEILIPLPTITPTPVNFEITQTAAARQDVEIDAGMQLVPGQEFGCYTVVEGDTLVGIMDLYDTTLEVLSQRNPNLGWFGCDFTNPSGGPSCNPNIRIGECINVPLPTSTPVPTTTPSGNETATPIPTYPPARTFFPPQGALASGRVELQWVSVGILKAGEAYLIELADRTANAGNNFVTRNTSFTLPDDIIPTDGQIHSMDWRVSVAQQNQDGTYTTIGGLGRWRNFQWRSR
jgi:hypothetical protein